MRGGDARNVRVSGNDQRIRVQGESGADLNVRVPRRARVEVKTTSGDISATDCAGSVDLESTSGEFRVNGDPEIVDIEGISGSIHIMGRPQRAFPGHRERRDQRAARGRQRQRRNRELAASP